MPLKPPSPCLSPGCPKLVTGSYCHEHRHPTTTQSGYNRHWRAYSKSYRLRHPACVMCEAEGILTQATQVDHITPVEGPHDRMFWDPSNHQSVCRDHASQTALEPIV